MKGQQNIHTHTSTSHNQPHHPFAPPSSSTTITDNYNTNVTMVDVNKSINSITPNIAQDIQNWVPRRIGSESMETRLFREFFGTSVRVVEILWELIVCDKL
jgi:hypothetical protein